MRYLVKTGIITKTNGKVKGSTDMMDVVTSTLTDLGVPFESQCCPSATNRQPVGYNPVTGQLETVSNTTWSSPLGATQTLTGAGAVSLLTYATLLVTTGANAITLAAGTDGQRKLIKFKTSGGNATLTPSSLQGGTTITFTTVGNFVELVYLDGKWNIISNSGTTIA